MLHADHGGLHSAAASLSAAAHNLSALAANPLTHPALAADEVSSTAALRLTEHGAVLVSRAADGAAVLASAANAVREASRAYHDMDTANASVVALKGDPGSAASAMKPAATVDAAAPDVPIAASPPRDGQVSAAILEAGNAESGAGFVTGCESHATAFRNCAVAARTARAAVSESLTGQAGPRIAAALDRFAGWADDMASHAAMVATVAAGHKTRYQTARHDTPGTAEFEAKRRDLANAELLYQRYPAAYGPVIATLQSQLMAMHGQAGVAAATYHVGELPAAPPPPPPVVPVVDGAAPVPTRPVSGAGEGPTDATQQADAAARDDVVDEVQALDETLDDVPVDPAAAELRSVTDPATDPGAQIAPMAAMLPGLFAGVLGGVAGMAASIGQQIGQQVQSLASQAVQGVSGLTSGLAQPDIGEFDSAAFDPDGLGRFDSGLGSSGGGGGGTDPAAGPPLAASGGGMLASAAPSAASTPLVGQASPGVGAPAAAAGPAGVPMGMMPMAGMGAGAGGGGARQVKEPDKTIHLEPEPNSEPVKGEVVRRETAVSDDPTGEASKPRPAVAVSVSSTRRRIEVPNNDDGGGGNGGV